MSSNAVDAVSSDDLQWTTRSITSNGSPSMTILEVVASITNDPIERLDPLYEVIDPDALNTLVERGGSDLSVQFDYEGCTVVVTGTQVRATDAQPVP